MSLRILIAVKSCARDAENGFNQTIRETWGKDVRGADLRFFLGQGAVARKEDEVLLDCPDDYRSLPYKTKAICKWAWYASYDFVFLCDSDTFVMPERLLASGFWNYDYVGHFNGPGAEPNAVYGQLHAWAAGGSGYWLSREAMGMVMLGNPQKSICPVSEVPCEDIMVGQVLGPLIATNTIIVSHDPRYALSFREDYKVEISAHYGSESAERVFDPSWMKKHYEVNKQLGAI